MHSRNRIKDSGSLGDEYRGKSICTTANGDRGVFQRSSRVKRNRWVQTKSCEIQINFMLTDLADYAYLRQEHIEDM
jgi:hypothetical protein